MSQLLKLTSRIIVIYGCLFCATGVVASEKITIMVSSIEKQIYLPAKLAERLGYLRETGLDIELQSVPDRKSVV